MTPRSLAPLALLLAACSSSESCLPPASHAFLGRYWQADERLAQELGGMAACFALYPWPDRSAWVLWEDGYREGPYTWEPSPGGGAYVVPESPAGELRVEAGYSGADAWDVTVHRGVLSLSWTAGRCRWL